jgi:hypothetical protein
MNCNPHASPDWTSRIRRNTFRLGCWTGAWTASTALATFGPRFLWQGNTSLSAAAVVLNVVLGLCMILANRTYLRGLDELQQKIHLDAMAIALGIAVVVGIAYSIMDQTDIIPGDAEIGFLVIVIGLSYIIGILVGQRRFR